METLPLGGPTGPPLSVDLLQEKNLKTSRYGEIPMSHGAQRSCSGQAHTAGDPCRGQKISVCPTPRLSPPLRRRRKVLTAGCDIGFLSIRTLYAYFTHRKNTCTFIMIVAGILGSMGYKLNPRLTTVDPDHFNLLGRGAAKICCCCRAIRRRRNGFRS